MADFKAGDRVYVIDEGLAKLRAIFAQHNGGVEVPHHHGTTTAPPRHHHGTTTAPPRHHHGTTTAPPRHHHGTIADDSDLCRDADVVLINFDDGGCAPYPIIEVRRLMSEPRAGGNCA